MNAVTFRVRITAARIDKGLLAIPKRFAQYFPNAKGTIEVKFDDGETATEKKFTPAESKDKECRIFGMRAWYLKRQVVSGDILTITVDTDFTGAVRIELDRYKVQLQEAKAVISLRASKTEEEATASLERLARARRKRTREVALAELSGLALEPRKRVMHAQPAMGKRESTPAAIRTMLGVVHDGRCQICSFTFRKRDGSPFYEIHHIDADDGHHPKNLLLVCANCHAQLELGNVGSLTWNQDWPIGVEIDGRLRRIRQPFVKRRVTTIPLLLLSLALSSTGPHNGWRS